MDVRYESVLDPCFTAGVWENTVFKQQVLYRFVTISLPLKTVVRTFFSKTGLPPSEAIFAYPIMRRVDIRWPLATCVVLSD